nr:flagellar hook-length control protein FliK [Candidatus Brocadiales bacterium]
LKKQIQGKPLSPKADNNQQTQQGVAQTQIEGEETPKIFEVSANTTENKAGKLFDNTTITSSNDAKTVESVMTPNTSSDNSAFNNQGANTDFDFSSNTVNNNQKTRPETNFNNTLSQINNSAKPLGTIGNDVADNIIQSAKLYTQGGKSEVKVQLSPPELGTIKLEFKVEDNVLETKITVERSSVKDVIEKDISRLRELISNADIDVGKLDVSLQDNENNKMDFMNKDFQSNSKSKSPQNLSQEESESNEGNLDEEPISNNRESTQINYLV